MLGSVAPTTRLDGTVRLRALDGVRGIAGMGVLLFHVGAPGVLGGALGVDLFFVLSGFLITSLLLAERERAGIIDLPRFWARRATRLWPPLAVVLLLGIPWASTLSSGHSGSSYAHEAASAATWSMNITTTAQATALHPLGFTWTLAQEEQFYLLWPLVLVVAFALGLRARGCSLLALGAAALSWALLILGWHGSVFLPPVYSRPDTRAFPILIGCALALGITSTAWVLKVLQRNDIGLLGSTALAGGLALPGLQHWSERATVVGGAPMVAVGGALVIGHVATRRAGPVDAALRFHPLAALGRISYSLYLVQKPVLDVVYSHDHHVLPRRGPYVRVVEVLIALAAAVVLWAVVERPAQRLAHGLLRRGSVRETLPARGHRPARVRFALAAGALGAVPVVMACTGAALSVGWGQHPTTVPSVAGPAP